MEDKIEVLETPQINVFNHENNVFGLAFKQISELNRSISIAPGIEIESHTLTDSLNSSSNSNFHGPSPTSSSSSSSSMSFFPTNLSSEQTMNHTKSSSAAPKKSILLRTISQNDSENQKLETNKIGQILAENQATLDNQNVNQLAQNANKKYNIPLFDQLLSKNDSSPSANVQILNENNQIVGKAKPNLSGLLPIQIISENFNINNINANKTQKDEPGTPDNDFNNNKIPNKTTKTDNIQLANFSEKTTAELMREYRKTDSVLSSNSASSYDDIVSSSDQTSDKKPKKRRLIELNSEARKEQIRNSNREAARRCRERKRNYIDFLEKKIRSLESKSDELMVENTKLKTLLSEHKNCNLANKMENNIGALVLSAHNSNQVKLPVYQVNLPSTNNLLDMDEKVKLSPVAAVASNLNFFQPNPTPTNNLNEATVLNDPQAIQKLLQVLIANKQNHADHGQNVEIK